MHRLSGLFSQGLLRIGAPLLGRAKVAHLHAACQAPEQLNHAQHLYAESTFRGLASARLSSAACRVLHSQEVQLVTTQQHAQAGERSAGAQTKGRTKKVSGGKWEIPSFFIGLSGEKGSTLHTRPADSARAELLR